MKKPHRGKPENRAAIRSRTPNIWSHWAAQPAPGHVNLSNQNQTSWITHTLSSIPICFLQIPDPQKHEQIKWLLFQDSSLTIPNHFPRLAIRWFWRGRTRRHGAQRADLGCGVVTLDEAGAHWRCRRECGGEVKDICTLFQSFAPKNKGKKTLFLL